MSPIPLLKTPVAAHEIGLAAPDSGDITPADMLMKPEAVERFCEIGDISRMYMDTYT